MKKLLFYICLAVSVALTACSAKEETPADIPQATERGQNDARALLTISADNVRELHSALLSVKAREWEMRREGNPQAADAYINAFKEYVTGNNSSLAAEIF